MEPVSTIHGPTKQLHIGAIVSWKPGSSFRCIQRIPWLDPIVPLSANLDTGERISLQVTG